MKKAFTQTMTGCLAMILAAALFIAALPATNAQPPDDIWSIPFSGIDAEHEGAAGWNADGSGPEPEATGHMIPFPGFGTQLYYLASRDYGGIDLNPSASGGHFLPDITGFPLFVQALEDNGFAAAQLKMKFGLASLGEDVLGQDWFVMGDWLHSIYYDNPFKLVLDGHLILQGACGFSDMYIQNVANPFWLSESGYVKLDSAWAEGTPETIKAVGRALVDDLDGEEIRIIFTSVNYVEIFGGNGRDGAKYDVTGYLEKGLPELPYLGLAADHQGMAGWNADGSGPEPYGDGHGAQRYYIGSRDYDDIDPDPSAAFGHFLPDMKGFLNFKLQLAYRNYTADQVVIKQGLSSLGNDIMGMDWGLENGTDYWCHYYDIDYRLELDGEQIIRGLIDTSHSWMNADPVYWWCDVTPDRPRDKSSLSSPDAQIIAAAFMKDLESRKIINDLQLMTYDTQTFSGNGRYDGGFFNIETASLVAKHMGSCCFVQCDSLCNGMTDHTHWTLAKSPYFLDNDLVIDERHTLFVDPGVKVAIRGPYNIKVNGRILAQGTEEHGIIFTQSNPLLEWNSFTFDATPDNRKSKFEYCIFERSHSTKVAPYNSGGAVGIRDFDSLLFSHCNFRFNRVDLPGALPPSGGAMVLSGSSPLIEYCTFQENSAAYGGAIICYLGSNPLIKYSLFHGNYATSDGGAIEIFDSSAPVLINNTITENHAGSHGGGVDLYMSDADSVTFINNIILGNSCAAGQPGQQVSLSSDNNLVSFKFNDIGGGLEGIGPGDPSGVFYSPSNIDTDSLALFCLEGENPYALYDCSPCANQGMGGTFIGAFDWACICTNIDENLIFNNDITFYPNPAFSGSVSVSFFMENTGPAKLEIYNLNGEKVAEPVDGFYAKGGHQLTIATEGLPAGIYVGRLTAGNKVMTAKFVRIK